MPPADKRGGGYRNSKFWPHRQPLSLLVKVGTRKRGRKGRETETGKNSGDAKYGLRRKMNRKKEVGGGGRSCQGGKGEPSAGAAFRWGKSGAEARQRGKDPEESKSK